jgi:hypothetical protein
MSDPSSANATDRIVAQSSRRQRERAQIPIPRNAAIIETSTSLNQGDSKNDINSDLADFISDTSPISETRLIEIPDELNLENGTTIRLQRSVFRETKLDGADKDYNRDTFFEAAWLILKDHPEVQKQVIAEAQRRSTLRRQLGRTRAAKTMGNKAI